jgi:hypothetical protein
MTGAMERNHPETAASVTAVTLGYRARCTEPACRNLGRLILRHADAGGRPMNNAEVCHAHARVRIEGARGAGLKVYDDRRMRTDYSPMCARLG